MKRRDLLLATGALFMHPQAGAQPAPRRVAVVAVGSLDRQPLASLVDGLRALGHEAGRNLELSPPATKQGYAVLSALAADAVRNRAEVIVTFGTTATQAAMKATSVIPIVIVVGTDPVEMGFVRNYARPEGNVTGQAHAAQELVAKRLVLLREIVPTMRRLGVVWNPASSGQAASLRLVEQEARRLGVGVHPVEVRGAADLERARAAIAAARLDALIIVPSTQFLELGRELVRLAAAARLPAAFTHADFVDAGGLMSYSPDLKDQFRHAAVYVDRILKGARPAELPVEQPVKFELVINRGTARALGLSIPQSVLLRADRVVE
jgi:putative ABC transport system substrate-binding protein